MYRYTRLGLLATFIVATGATALAAVTDNNDALPILKAKTSLSQAVAAAEQHVHGKASRAEFEHSQQGWVYDVEVVQDTKVFDVRVDANNATVIAAVEDGREHDDDYDKQD